MTFHDAVERELVCPRCNAMNRPGATVIVWDARTQTAACSVCAHAGAIETFIQKGGQP